MPLQQLVELMQEELFQKAPLITEQKEITGTTSPPPGERG